MPEPATQTWLSQVMLTCLVLPGRLAFASFLHESSGMSVASLLAN
jgi:hypothetical protein